MFWVSCVGGVCALVYLEGMKVTPAAVVDYALTCVGWSGVGCFGMGSCVVTLDRDVTVFAVFEAVSKQGEVEEAGKAIVLGKIRGKGNSVVVKLACRGGGACKGVLKLFVRFVGGYGKGKRWHKKWKLVLIGKRSFSIAAGKLKTIKVKIGRGVLRQLWRAGKGGLKVKLAGGGVQNRVVKLKQQGGKKKKNRRRHRRGFDRVAVR